MVDERGRTHMPPNDTDIQMSECGSEWSLGEPKIGGAKWSIDN